MIRETFDGNKLTTYGSGDQKWRRAALRRFVTYAWAGSHVLVSDEKIFTVLADRLGHIATLADLVWAARLWRRLADQHIATMKTLGIFF